MRYVHITNSFRRMQTWFSFFLPDLLLLSYVFGGILCIAFQKRVMSVYQQTLHSKKLFYLLLNTAVIVLVVALIMRVSVFFVDWQTTDLLPFLTNAHRPGLLFGNHYFRQDSFSLFSVILLNCISLCYCILLYLSLAQKRLGRFVAEMPVLLITIIFSFNIFLMTFDFVIMVLSLEIGAFCLIILMTLAITTTDAHVFPLEAAIKYFIFNAVAVMLLLIAGNGYLSIFQSFYLVDISLAIPSFLPDILVFPERLLITHLCFFLAYLLKLGAAPFHFWVPDVYEGVEMSITTLLILIVGPMLLLKFVVFCKLLLPVMPLNYAVKKIILGFGICSVALGTLNAFRQYRLKRFFAFTGIVHLGFMLIGCGCSTVLGYWSVLFYLIIYIITNILMFSLLLLLRAMNHMTLTYLSDINLIIRQNPYMVILFCFPLFSYGGFPPFAGFFSKFLLLVAVLDVHKWHLFFFLLVFFLLSAYLYLRVIKVFLFDSMQLRTFLPVNITTLDGRSKSSLFLFLGLSRLEQQNAQVQLLRLQQVPLHLLSRSFFLEIFLFSIILVLTLFMFFFTFYPVILIKPFYILLTLY